MEVDRVLPLVKMVVLTKPSDRSLKPFLGIYNRLIQKKSILEGCFNAPVHASGFEMLRSIIVSTCFTAILQAEQWNPLKSWVRKKTTIRVPLLHWTSVAVCGQLAPIKRSARLQLAE